MSWQDKATAWAEVRVCICANGKLWYPVGNHRDAWASTMADARRFTPGEAEAALREVQTNYMFDRFEIVPCL